MTEPTITDLEARVAELESRVQWLTTGVLMAMEERRRDAPPAEDTPRTPFEAERYLADFGSAGVHSERAAFIQYQYNRHLKHGGPTHALTQIDPLYTHGVSGRLEHDWSEVGWLRYQRARDAGTWVGDIWEGVPGAE